MDRFALSSFTHQPLELPGPQAYPTPLSLDRTDDRTDNSPRRSCANNPHGSDAVDRIVRLPCPTTRHHNGLKIINRPKPPRTPEFHCRSRANITPAVVERRLPHSQWPGRLTPISALK